MIACDTDVVLTGRRSGSPNDEVEAREYLDRMSGRAHEVLSGLVILDGEEESSGLERTSVDFKDLSEAERSVMSIRRVGGAFRGLRHPDLGVDPVERVEGSVSNVVGLPVGLLIELAPGFSSGPEPRRVPRWAHGTRRQLQRALMSSHELRSSTCIESKYAAAGRCSPS